MGEFRAKVYICDRCGKREILKEVDEKSSSKWDRSLRYFLCEECTDEIVKTFMEDWFRVMEEDHGEGASS